MMGKKVKQECDNEDPKSKLVSEICSLSARSIGCVHRNVNSNHFSSRSSSSKSHFVDWYRLLGVEETSGVDVIRKKYHKLALQLHPDKNKHPNAEIAFKLVLEAYACLTDNAKRRAFDLERWKNFCFQCNTIPYTNNKISTTTTKFKTFAKKDHFTANWSSTCKILRSLKDMKARFREEAKVIENCLRTNAAAAAASKKESPVFNMCRSNSYKESPVFNPSDYVFQGYPHLRTRIQKKPERFCFLQSGHFLNSEPRTQYYHDSPIFEIRSESASFRSRSAFVYS